MRVRIKIGHMKRIEIGENLEGAQSTHGTLTDHQTFRPQSPNELSGTTCAQWKWPLRLRRETRISTQEARRQLPQSFCILLVMDSRRNKSSQVGQCSETRRSAGRIHN